MTRLPHVNLSVRQAPYHPAELLSDADPPRNQVIEHGDGHLHLYRPDASGDPAPAVALSHATSAGSAATRDAQAFGSFGAAPEGPHELTHVGVQG